jgi:molybdopterin-guanine dinucleotide biosynthesis protein A
MKFSAVLLAGGESKRMGQDKALIAIRGKPLWLRQLDLLRRLHPSEILVSARTDPEWRPREIHYIEDAQPSRGPLSGIAACLARIQTEHLFVLAVDMPFMAEKCLLGICAEISPGLGVVPVFGDRAEPLAAVYPRESLTEFSKALGGQDFSLQPLVRKLVAAGQLRPLAISPEQIPCFQSINEPGQLDFATITDMQDGRLPFDRSNLRCPEPNPGAK